MFAKLKAAPGVNPFKLYPTRPDGKPTRRGVRDGYKLTWQKKELPGAGAGQYAYETYGLPPYPVYGAGNINVTNPLRETSPAAYVFQSVGVVGVPPKGLVQGQFTTQPLMDVNNAQSQGLVTPGAVLQGPNQITNPSPVLNP